MSVREETYGMAAKAAVGFSIAGLTLNEWVAILTGAYLLLQMGLLLPKYYRCLCFRKQRARRRRDRGQA